MSSARQRFDKRLQSLSRRSARISDPIFTCLAFTALADLAADLEGSDADHTRDLLTVAGTRLIRIAARRPKVQDPIKEWTNGIDGKGQGISLILRTHAIRDAERRMTKAIEGTSLSLPLAGYWTY